MVTARRTEKQDRIAKGLCPTCGKEAAPYYLCSRCRFYGKIGRVLRRAGKAGAFTRTVDKKGVVRWGIGSEAAFDAMTWRPDPKEGDGRLRPRLGRVPVDVEGELVALLTSMGKPATIDEIVAAWGQLRERRRVSIANDMATIIAAQRKREARARKRAGLVQQADSPQ